LEYLDHFDKQAAMHHFVSPFPKLSKTLDFQEIKNN